MLLAAAGGCSDEPPTGEASAEAEATLAGLSVDVRNDPGCGCCTSWVEYLEDHGAAVELREDPQRDAFRTDVGIVDDAASCHTAIVDGYAIEGHVPADAIRRLLAERPDAVGLALPGMPADAPGMGGDEATWARQPVVLVTADGGRQTWEY